MVTGGHRLGGASHRCAANCTPAVKSLLGVYDSMVVEPPVKAGALCKHGLSTTFPCSKCRVPKASFKVPIIFLLAVGFAAILGIAKLIAG